MGLARRTLRDARAAGAAVAVACAALGPRTAGAQGSVALAPKPSLTLPGASACVRQAPPPAARRDEAGARVAAARARELALVGDRAGARDAFARAATLDPANPAYAYDLGRAAEEVGDAPNALSAYCRYLTLAPAGAESGEVRTRVQRLGDGGGAADTEQRARAAFGRGLTALRERRWPQATSAFDEVLRLTPNAPEASYNRGLAHLAQGRDEAAARDLAAYVASPVAGADRAQVLRAVDALQRPRWSPAGAFGRGLVIPGFGQMYTGRAIGGVAVLAATAGAVAWGLMEETTTTQQQFVDPFGNPYTAPVTTTDRPNLTAGLAGAAVLVTGAALEASLYASRKQRDRPTVSVRTSSVTLPAPRGGTTRRYALGLDVAF